jgi:two-component system chemotaxis response regulator CheY
MDLLPLLTNQRVQSLVAHKLLESISNSLKLQSPTITKTLVEKSSGLIMGLAHIRLQFSKGSQVILIGTSDKNTYQRIKESPDCQAITLGLGQVLKEGIEAEFAASTGSMDLKKILVAQEELNTLYKKYESDVFLRFSIGSENPLIFEIPITCRSYQNSYSYSELGYQESARVLVVDDSKMNRMVLKNYLNALGFNQVEEGFDGKDGLNKIYKSLNKFDLVIADWHMPEMTGLEMLKSVRGNMENRATPFILATSEQKKEEIVEALKYKVSGYVIKPYSLEQLIKAIKNSSK